MIRPITCICMMLAAGSGLYLYQVKHRTEMLDRKIEQTLKTTDAVHERTRLLSAEWALLNDPSRLSDMAAKFLSLHPVAPNQFVTMAELDKRLPPVQEYPPPGATAPAPAPAQPHDEPIAQATPTPAPQQTAHISLPEKAPEKIGAEKPAPERLAAISKPAPHVLAPALPEKHEPEKHETERHEVASVPSQHTAIGAVAGPMATPVSNPVMLNPVLSRVMATNARPSPNRQDEYAASVSGTSASSLGHSTRVTTYAPTNNQPRVSSALGNARNLLAPPVPVSAQAALLEPR